MDTAFWNEVLLEGIKAFMTLVVLGIIGLLIRNWIDTKSRRKEDKEVAKNEALEFKRNIIDEYIDVFSSFYSIRKLYHSALDPKNRILDDAERKKIMIDSLKNSTKQAGKYGTLKVRIINHYKLPKDNWDAKKIKELESGIEESEQPNEVFRMQLDLMGEYYDMWLNSIELGSHIDAEGNPKFYKLYNDILTTLEARRIDKTVSSS